MKGTFIVLEGPDKSGKSTQAALLAKALRRRGREVVHTREPGGTRFAEAIRRLVLMPGVHVEPLAELLLYEAARAQHTNEKIRPALKRGAVVLCERYTMATAVYQGHARGLDQALISKLNRIATGGLKPGLTIVLDVPETEFHARKRRRKADRLELEPQEFRRRVREGYRKQKGAAHLNGRRPISEVRADIRRLVERKLGL